MREPGDILTSIFPHTEGFRDDPRVLLRHHCRIPGGHNASVTSLIEISPLAPAIISPGNSPSDAFWWIRHKISAVIPWGYNMLNTVDLSTGTSPVNDGMICRKLFLIRINLIIHSDESTFNAHPQLETCYCTVLPRSAPPPLITRTIPEFLSTSYPYNSLHLVSRWCQTFLAVTSLQGFDRLTKKSPEDEPSGLLMVGSATVAKLACSALMCLGAWRVFLYCSLVVLLCFGLLGCFCFPPCRGSVERVLSPSNLTLQFVCSS